MIRKFKQPDSEYRSAPFWSWNDDLNDKHLQYQLDEMKKGGMAGGFMHSRVGLITPYLSKEFMKHVTNTVKYAKKIGIPIYLYDEDRWPSGFASGMVTRKKRNQMEVLWGAKTKGKWRFKAMNDLPSPWYNNITYLDTLSQRAVKNFIASTHQLYFKEIGSEFGKTVPAIFTDEPNYSDIFHWGRRKKGLPWTDKLKEIFKGKYDYRLEENLVSLFDEKKDYQKVRYHYWKLVSELFQQNFGKQIYDWCKENNIALTGHYLEEDTLTSQTRAIGAAMPLYEYMQIPGVDHLARQIDSTYLTIKQCSSVAHQLGKERVLSELFGCSGQNMTFTDRKWIGNWDTILGVNLFCPHLWLYSMAGRRKRAYPPTISYQQPYWKYNKKIEDYFARVNFITSQGKFHCNILVIHPIESAWCLYNPANTKPVDKLNNKFISMLKTLSGQHYDYDLGDESIISRHGKVRASLSSGERVQAQSLFKVGEMSYRLVIIPPVITLRKTTVELLNSFIDSGGKVIGFKPIPERIDGQKDSLGLIKQLYSRITLLPELSKSLIYSITTLLEKDIFITNIKRGVEIKDIYYQHRILNDTDIYFLVNNNKEKSYSVEVKIPAKRGNVLEIWDPITGEISLLEVQRENGYLNCCLYFSEASSHVLVRRESKKPARKQIFAQSNWQNSAYIQGEKIARFSKQKWVCKRKNLNSITLDYCQYKTGNMKRWSKSAYVLDVQKIFEKRSKNNAPFSIKYSFKTKVSRKPNQVFLVLERPEQYEILVNNRKLSYEDMGYWIDISFRKVDITDYIRLKGENTIELRSRFTYPRKRKTFIYVKGGTEIESIYLVGSFNVKGRFRSEKEGIIGQEFTVADSSEPLASDTVISGYPFYAGEFVFSQKFDFSANIPKGRRIFLSLGKLGAITLKVTLNKKEAGLILWPPYCLDITDFLNRGKNLIEIEITNSLRNLLGPHHQKTINPEVVGPDSFNDKKSWINDYTFMPFGLGKSIKVKW